MNNAAVNIHVLVFTWTYVFILFSLWLGMEFLGHMVTLYLIFWGTVRIFSILVAPFYIPISSVWRFQFLNTLPILNYLFFKNYYKIRPSGCIMKSGISPWFGFAFFLITSDIEHIFMYLLTSCMSFLENYIQVLCPVKNWIFF